MTMSQVILIAFYLLFIPGLIDGYRRRKGDHEDV